MAYLQQRTRSDGTPVWRVGWRGHDRKQTWSPPIYSADLAESIRAMVEDAGPVFALRTLAELQGREHDDREQRRIDARIAWLEDALGVKVQPWQRRIIADAWPD